MRFSSPGNLPSIVASTSPQWRQGMPPSCEQRSQSYCEGRDRASPSSRYEVRVLQPLLHCTQERWWVKTNLGPARLEPGPSQAPVQNAHTETHLWVRPSPRLVCSDRPEGHVLPRVDPSAPQAIPAVCVRRTGISVQSPALRAIPVAPCLHESSGGSPCSPERTGRAHSQLPRRLAYTSSVAGPVMRTQGLGALTPQPGWAFRSTGKRANSARCRGSLFSVWSWTRSVRQRASRRNALSRCWTAWIHSRTGRRHHWNSFRGSWGTLHGRTGTQLAAGPSQVCISPSEPSRTDTVQGQGGRGADPARGAILTHQDLVPRADAPRDSPSLADSSEERSTDSETGHLMALASRPLETSCLFPGRDAEVLGDLPQEVVDTITSARAPSTSGTCLTVSLEVEPVRRMVLFSQRRPTEMPDQSRAVLLAARVGAKAISLHPQGLRGRDCCQPRPCGREVGGEAWLGRQVP